MSLKLIALLLFFLFPFFTEARFGVGIKVQSISYTHPLRSIPQQRTLQSLIWYPTYDTPTSPLYNYYSSVPASTPLPEFQSKVAQLGATMITNQTLPIIFLEHGFCNFVQNYYPIAEHLTSNGYVVVGINHVGENLLDPVLTDSQLDYCISKTWTTYSWENYMETKLVLKPLDLMYTYLQLSELRMFLPNSRVGFVTHDSASAQALFFLNSKYSSLLLQNCTRLYPMEDTSSTCNSITNTFRNTITTELNTFANFLRNNVSISTATTMVALFSKLNSSATTSLLTLPPSLKLLQLDMDANYFSNIQLLLNQVLSFSSTTNLLSLKYSSNYIFTFTVLHDCNSQLQIYYNNCTEYMRYKNSSTPIIDNQNTVLLQWMDWNLKTQTTRRASLYSSEMRKYIANGLIEQFWTYNIDVFIDTTLSWLILMSFVVILLLLFASVAVISIYYCIVLIREKKQRQEYSNEVMEQYSLSQQ